MNAAEQVTAVAHDNPIPGFGTRNTINLRLWAAKPDKEFDLEAFNTGDYVQVNRHTLRAALLTWPLSSNSAAQCLYSSTSIAACLVVLMPDPASVRMCMRAIWFDEQ